MKPPLRILDTGLRPARCNVAVTAGLVEMHARDKVPDTVRFHRYEPCVLLGRSQDAERVADVGYCRQAAVEIAHRITGGGAVYMTPRMLAWDVVVARRVFGGDLELATRRICEAVASGLCRLGCAARFRPASDVAIGGRKVSGSSGYAQGRSVVLQGTVLIEDDAATMARALRIPEATLRGAVTCLSEALGEVPSLDRVRDAIVGGLAGALDRSPAHGDLGPDAMAAAEAVLRADGLATGAPDGP